jgi:hypothetical protein
MRWRARNRPGQPWVLRRIISRWPLACGGSAAAKRSPQLAGRSTASAQVSDCSGVGQHGAVRGVMMEECWQLAGKAGSRTSPREVSDAVDEGGRSLSLLLWFCRCVTASGRLSRRGAGGPRPRPRPGRRGSSRRRAPAWRRPDAGATPSPPPNTATSPSNSGRRARSRTSRAAGPSARPSSRCAWRNTLLPTTSAGSALAAPRPELAAVTTVTVRSPGVARPAASVDRPPRSSSAVARCRRGPVNPTQGPARVSSALAGPRASKNSAAVPASAISSSPATASHSGSAPAATRSPTTNMRRSPGSGMGTPASMSSRPNRLGSPRPPPAASMSRTDGKAITSVHVRPWGCGVQLPADQRQAP